MTFTQAALRLVLLSAACSTAAFSQSHGYVFFGPGAVSGSGFSNGRAYMGAGGDYVSRIGVGFGAEIGYTAPWRQFRDGIGIGSVNGSYQFGRAGKVVPFVTGGYSLLFRSATENAFNFGGGVNWWFADRLGLKLELRDHVGTGGFRETHFWTIRAGLNFR